VLGNVEFLGNPVGLVNNLGTGVKDFFYEPLEGLKGDGDSKNFLEGLKRGTASLGSNFSEGLGNSMSKITGTIGEGIAQISMDKDYLVKRNKARTKEANTVGQGLRKGVFEFGEGLAGAVSGVVVQPIRGMEKQGVYGFGKGLFKGVVGVAVKPVVGILDMTSRATEGIKNESKRLRNFSSHKKVGERDGEGEGEGEGRTENDLNSVTGGGFQIPDFSSYIGADGRSRNSRAFGPTGELIEYDPGKALKQRFLGKIEKGKYAFDIVLFDWRLRTLDEPAKMDERGEFFSQKIGNALKGVEKGGEGEGGDTDADTDTDTDTMDKEIRTSGSVETPLTVAECNKRNLHVHDFYLIVVSHRDSDATKNKLSLLYLVDDQKNSEGLVDIAAVKPRLIWACPLLNIKSVKCERGGVVLDLWRGLKYRDDAGVVKGRVKREDVSIVYDLKSQEVSE